MMNTAKLLNWAGIAFLVLGAVFALMYSWQFLSVWVKLAAAFALSGGLIAFGEKLSRRDTNQWYGQGLIGGGWSLAYFVVYAMQNLTQLKVMDSVALNCTMLVALAAGCMAHAVGKRSEVMAILSTILAFISISLSSITTFSVVASAVLVIGVAIVTVRMNWRSVQMASLVGSYLTYALFVQPQIEFQLAGAFLLLFWLVHNAVAYVLAGRDQPEKLASTAITVNAMAFIPLGLRALSLANLGAHNWLFLFLTGIAYLAGAGLFGKRNAGLITPMTLIGLTLETTAIPLKLNHHGTNIIWLLEMPVLMWLGLTLNRPTIRWFATALSVISLISVTMQLVAPATYVPVGSALLDWRLVVSLVAAMCFTAMSRLYFLPLRQCSSQRRCMLGVQRMPSCCCSWNQ
jgi:hypothetical protein